MADHPKSKSMGGFVIQMGKAKLKSMRLPTCEICGGMVFWAWLEPEVGDGARLGADGHAHHVLHLVDAVALWGSIQLNINRHFNSLCNTL